MSQHREILDADHSIPDETAAFQASLQRSLPRRNWLSITAFFVFLIGMLICFFVALEFHQTRRIYDTDPWFQAVYTSRFVLILGWGLSCLTMMILAILLFPQVAEREYGKREAGIESIIPAQIRLWRSMVILPIAAVCLFGGAFFLSQYIRSQSFETPIDERMESEAPFIINDSDSLDIQEEMPTPNLPQ